MSRTNGHGSPRAAKPEPPQWGSPRARKRGVFSHSRLSTFEDCPKRFEYRYVLKIPTEREGIEAFVGKRVHEVLEKLYLVARDGRVPSLHRVIYRFRQMFDDGYDEERVQIVRRGTDRAFYREYGERCLTRYYRRHYPFDRGETLGLEQHVAFDLDDSGEYRLQGIIDRLSRDNDGVVEIHDYKTGRRVPTQAQLDEDRQLALYQIGLSKRFPDSPIRLVWHYLAQDRSFASTRSPEQLEALQTGTIQLIDQIGATTQFEPKKSGLCDWCEYNDRCPIYPRKKGGDAPAVPVVERSAEGQLALF